MRFVTALRERPRGRVDVELDGVLWRTLPIDAVVRAGLRLGRPLDRETARSLARELRRSKAVRAGVRALQRRDLSKRVLADRLPAAGRDEALDVLERSGYLDDRRAAASRASSLAARGWGDEAVRVRLEEEGFGTDAVETALAALAPEAARALAFRAGGKSERWLAARGFEVATDA